MLDNKILLEIKSSISSTFADHKINLGDPTRDSVTKTFADSDYIYIGFFKPIKAFYIDLATANTNDITLSFEYYNGSAWTTLSNAIDETNGLTRSGFIQWPESDFKDSTDNLLWDANEVDSLEKYWVRISFSAASSETTFNFIGLVFSDDTSLLTQLPYANDTQLLSGQSNHLKYHVSARDEIINKLESKGYFKIDTDNNVDRITPWDLLDINQVKLGAIYLVLSKIYFNLSDAVDDQWIDKSERLYERYDKMISNIRVSIDQDDDGETDNGERMKPVNISRLTR